MNEKSFDVKRIAEGYKTRPYLHKLVIEEFQKEFGNHQYENGLDVGCGAGLSTKALKMICSEVTGTDISQEMISVADEVCNTDGYKLFTSGAEDIPKPERLYDIVTAAGMVNWVKVDSFLQCMTDIMCSQGILLIYDFCITDQMEKDDGYHDWWHHQYLEKFPKPYRNETVWTQEDIDPFGFQLLGQVKYDMEYQFDMDGFITFMMLQSNVNAKIDNGMIDIEEAKKWFQETLKPIFKNQTRKLLFSGYSWYIKKN